MRRRGRLLQSSILTAALSVFAAPALAAEPAPGDTCPTLNYIIETGGPETSGVRHLLRCDGTHWQQEMTIDANGHVGIGTATPDGLLQVTNGPAGTDSHINMSVMSGNPHGDAYDLGILGDAGDGVFTVSSEEGNFRQALLLSDVGGLTDTYFGLSSSSDAGSSWNANFVVKQSGNVGIGTSAPADTLHIYSADTAGTGVTIATQGTLDQQAVLNLLTKSNGSDTLGDATSAGWQIWANGDASTAFAGLGGPNTFGIGFADGVGWDPAALQILSNGMVGIGTHANGDVPNTTLDVGGSFALSGDISPAQITANKNNYNPTGVDKAAVLRLSSDASRTITGLAGGADGRVLTILNVGSNPIVLANQSTSSTTANRFAIGADFTIGADQSASLIYDATSQRWRSAALPFESSGLTGPSGCAAIGDLCADGTVFAGWSPITQDQLFIPATDQGTTSKWQTSIGTDDIATDSTYDGRANTNQVANSATFPAFKLCKDLTTGGHSDWYLPSQVEMYYLWAVSETIQAKGHITNFKSAYYWSSTEFATYGAWFQSFPDGLQNIINKTDAYRVRCVRR